MSSRYLECHSSQLRSRSSSVLIVVALYFFAHVAVFWILFG
jgi:hypothetical protein